MEDILDIQVCFVNSTEQLLLKSISPRLVDNAILLVIDQRQKALTRIDGYNSRIVGSSQDCMKPLSVKQLKRYNKPLWPVLSEPTWDFIHSKAQWMGIRSEIIAADPQLEPIIERLEEAQRRTYLLLEAQDAVIFDGVRTAIQVFNPQGVSKYLDKLNDLRSMITASPTDIHTAMMVPQCKPLITTIAEALTELPNCSLYTPPDDNSFEGQLLSSYKLGEEDAIRQDFDTSPVDGYSLVDSGDSKASTLMLRFVDNRTNRRLLVIMAHRKGINNTDLGGADLIYNTQANSSLVFVQYKRVDYTTGLTYSQIGRKQLDQILGLCQKYSCAHRSHGDYIKQEHMRIGFCPMYYKLLELEPKIDEKSKRMQGIYLQACITKQIIDNTEKQKISITDRGLAYEVFYKLLGSSQIGSHADAYEDLCKEIIEGREKPFVYAQEQVIRSPKLQQTSFI